MAGARAGWRGQKSVRTSAFLCHDCGLAASSNPACLSAHRQQPHAAREDAASRRPHAPGVCGRSPSSSHSAACTSSDGGAAGSSAGACMAPAAPSAGVPRRGAVDQKDGARNRASRSHTSTPAASLCRGARPPLSLCPALPPPCPTCVSPIYYTCSYKGPSGPRIHGLQFQVYAFQKSKWRKSRLQNFSCLWCGFLQLTILSALIIHSLCAASVGERGGAPSLLTGLFARVSESL